MVRLATPGTATRPRLLNWPARSLSRSDTTPAPPAGNSPATSPPKSPPKPSPSPKQRRWRDDAAAPRITRTRRHPGCHRRGPDHQARSRQPELGPPPYAHAPLAHSALPAARSRLREHHRAGGPLVPAAGGLDRPAFPPVAAVVGAGDPARYQL